MWSAAWVSKVLGKASAWQRAVVLSLLAVISAFLSTYAPEDPWNISVVGGKSLLPGVYFGLVMSIGVLWWVTRSRFEIFTVFFVTVIAWFVAQGTAEKVFHFLVPTLDTPTNFGFAISGGVGGVVGASLTAYGVSLVCRQFRNITYWSRTILIGGFAGVFLEMAEKNVVSWHSLPIHVGSLLPLFLVWQLSVAASVGYGLGSAVGQNARVATRDTSPS
jgi:hypothetical protein